MSQQINLYEERLRPRHELSTGRNVSLALGVLLVLLAVAAVFSRYEAGRVTAEFAQLQTEVVAMQEKVSVLSKALAERKISPALQADIDNTRGLLASRKEVMELLDSGRLGNTTGFSAIMAGFAKQTSNDLWLTGFSVSMGGKEIEIRGRLLDSTKLPGYVQRLSNEPVFQGRRFSALDMQSVDPVAVKPDTSGAAAKTPVPHLPPYVEFVLRSENAGEAATLAGGKK